MRTFFHVVVNLLTVFSLAYAPATGLAQNPAIIWDSGSRVAIKGFGVRACQIVLAPLEEGRTSDSMGVRLAQKNDQASFRSSLEQAIAEKGLAIFDGADLYVSGINMKDEASVKTQYSETMASVGIDSSKTKLIVLSIPEAPAREVLRLGYQQMMNRMQKILPGVYQKIFSAERLKEFEDSAIEGMQTVTLMNAVRSIDIKEEGRHAKERLRNFFYSREKDYESPTKGELVSGLISTSGLEISNAVNLAYMLPWTDAALTLTIHTLTLAFYIGYQKTMGNWFMRTPTQVEMFAKQMVTSAPFIINYNIFGNFTELLTYLQTHSFSEASIAFPGLMTSLMSSQGVTTILQATFYWLFMGNGIRAWVNSVEGEADSQTARKLSNYIAGPVLFLDAVFLTMASADKPLPLLNIQNYSYNIGPLELSLGHALLAGLTLATYKVWTNPRTLDPILRWHKNVRAAISRPSAK